MKCGGNMSMRGIRLRSVCAGAHGESFLHVIHEEKAGRRDSSRGKGSTRRGIENPPEGKPDTPEGGPRRLF